MKIIIAVSLAIFFNISNSFAMDLPDENLGEEVLVLVGKPAVQVRAHRKPYDLVAEMLELLIRLDDDILADLQVAGVMRESLCKEGRLLEFMPDDGG